MKTRKRLLALLLCVPFLLTGCASKVKKDTSSVTLPPAKAVYQAPVGDENRSSVYHVLLYLHNRSTGLLEATNATLSVPSGTHPAQAAIERLLSFTGSDTLMPLSEDAALHLAQGTGFEKTGNTLTLNFDAGMLSLSTADILSAFRAITNTACQFGDIQYVNFLIAGISPGCDFAASLPLGTFTGKGDFRGSLSQREDGFINTVASIYYPAALGKGVLCESRKVSMDASSLSLMAHSLLDVLSSTPLSLSNLPDVPSLNALLQKDIEVEHASDGRGKVLSLHFLQEFNAAMIEAGIPRSSMMASITLTLTTFLPGVSAVKVTIGEEEVLTLSPTQIQKLIEQTLLFSQGQMDRFAFTPFLLENQTIFLAHGDYLKAVTKVTPASAHFSARTLFDLLLEGGNSTEIAKGFVSPLPANIRSSDLIGYALEDDVALINLSLDFLDAINILSLREAQKAVYSIVNTLCMLPNVNRVRFYIMGAQVKQLQNGLYMAGEFWYNPQIVE
jgi:hypothetical protein